MFAACLMRSADYSVKPVQKLSRTDMLSYVEVNSEYCASNSAAKAFPSRNRRKCSHGLPSMIESLYSRG